MIKAEDLRIGNWYDHHGSYKQVTPNTIEEVWEAERSWCKEIPLTDEILLKCGCVDKEHTMELDGLIFSWSSRVCATGVRSGWRCYDFPHIKHLHELQNLIKAIRNEELVLSL